MHEDSQIKSVSINTGACSRRMILHVVAFMHIVPLTYESMHYVVAGSAGSTGK